jgi:hypothetical protein
LKDLTIYQKDFFRFKRNFRFETQLSARNAPKTVKTTL